MVTKFDSKSIREMIYGVDALVDLGDGKMVPAVNLDNAATTPPFHAVNEKIQESLKYYGSIGRGAGQKSAITTKEYTMARKTVLNFVGADQRYTVFYSNCTTDGMNKLASALIKSSEDVVLTTRMEHHANDLPWRERGRTVYAEVDEKGRLLIEDFERILKRYSGKIKYVTVTAASNVTGYVNDVHRIAGIAHKYGAKIIVDGAQIVAHWEFNMLGNTRDEDIDFFVFSAHKMYSPYGGGAVVGLIDGFNNHVPCLYGGGMIETVTDDGVFYTELPDLYEAGSPNYPGVVGMAKAMEILKDIGFEYIANHEQTLLKKAINDLNQIPEVTLYGDSDNYKDRVGIIVFTIKDIDNKTVAKELANYNAIAVRQAAFCSHPYVRRLTKASVSYDDEGRPLHPTGLIRVSFGIYNSEDDIDCLVNAVRDIINRSRVKSMTIDKLACAYMAEVETGFEHLYRIPKDRG